MSCKNGDLKKNSEMIEGMGLRRSEFNRFMKR